MDDSRAEQVLSVAKKLFNTKPDWLTFFRDVLGLGGEIRTVFKTPFELWEFEMSSQYVAIESMLAELLKAGPPVSTYRDQQRVITVRLPASMHSYLQAEAHLNQTSMNHLCVAKLARMYTGGMEPKAA